MCLVTAHSSLSYSYQQCESCDHLPAARGRHARDGTPTWHHPDYHVSVTWLHVNIRLDFRVGNGRKVKRAGVEPWLGWPARTMPDVTMLVRRADWHPALPALAAQDLHAQSGVSCCILTNTLPTVRNSSWQTVEISIGEFQQVPRR